MENMYINTCILNDIFFYFYYEQITAIKVVTIQEKYISIYVDIRVDTIMN